MLASSFRRLSGEDLRTSRSLAVFLPPPGPGLVQRGGGGGKGFIRGMQAHTEPYLPSTGGEHPNPSEKRRGLCMNLLRFTLM